MSLELAWCSIPDWQLHFADINVIILFALLSKSCAGDFISAGNMKDCERSPEITSNERNRYFIWHKRLFFRSKPLLKSENISRSQERGKYICRRTRGETDWIPISGKIRQNHFLVCFALSTILISHRNSQPEHILEWLLLYLILGRGTQVWRNHSQNDNKHPPSGGKWRFELFIEELKEGGKTAIWRRFIQWWNSS